MKSHVRILVCGDEKVGKSSLISALVSQHFSRRVPPVMTDVNIPPDESDDGVSTTICDSSADPKHRAELLQKICEADAIVLLWDVERPDTYSHLGSFWLPLIAANTEVQPAGKEDGAVTGRLQGGLDATNSAQMDWLMERFGMVRAAFALECSAKRLLGVAEVFQQAHSMAVYPMVPLYDIHKRQLRPAFSRAVRRIFRLNDL
ncbi:unnamed protein product, partial [Phaeothamnion confervicola]